MMISISIHRHGFHAVKVRLSIGIGLDSSRTRSLDLDALNATAKKRLASEKEFMIVSSSVRTGGDTLEAVEVQLSLKAGVL